MPTLSGLVCETVHNLFPCARPQGRVPHNAMGCEDGGPPQQAGGHNCTLPYSYLPPVQPNRPSQGSGPRGLGVYTHALFFRNTRDPEATAEGRAVLGGADPPAGQQRSGRQRHEGLGLGSVTCLSTHSYICA